ncbi:MAG: hypothetical protein ABSG53_00670, partial [Thermoguttaceae bacterium]
MCSRRILLSQSRAVTAFGVVFPFLAILFGTIVGGCGSAADRGANEGDRWILVYKVDEQKTVWRPEKLDSLTTAIRRRVNPDGRKDISVRILGTNMVQIVLPSVSKRTAKERQAEADGIRKIIRTTGALEFRIVATKRENESLIEMAKTERKKFPVIPSKTVVISGPKTGKELAKWCRVRDQEVDKIKGDDAAMMVGKIQVKDGKEVQKEVWEVLVLSPE